MKKLEIQDKNIVRELFTSVFTKEPWNDDWTDENQLNSYLQDLMGQSNSLTYGLFEDGVLIGVSMGSFFLGEIEKEIKEKGMTQIYLQTENNVPAYDFYKHRGFYELKDHVSFGKDIL